VCLKTKETPKNSTKKQNTFFTGWRRRVSGFRSEGENDEPLLKVASLPQPG